MVPVSEEVYRAWWQETEHERYLERQSQVREISWQSREDISDEDTLSLFCSRSPQAPDDPGADALKQALLAALAEEPEALQRILWQLATGELTQQDLAQRWGVHKSNVTRKLTRIYERLRKKVLKSLSENNL